MVGGAEEMVLNLVRHLPPRFEPTVCCIHEEGPIGEEIRRTGTPVDVLGLTPGIRRPHDVFGIAGYLRASKPQIVHTFLLTASLYGRLAAILARVPIGRHREHLRTQASCPRAGRRAHLMAGPIVWSSPPNRCVISTSGRSTPIRRRSTCDNAVDFTQAQPTMSRAEMRNALAFLTTRASPASSPRIRAERDTATFFEALASQPASRTRPLLS
jgi:hypothetical protein